MVYSASDVPVIAWSLSAKSPTVNPVGAGAERQRGAQCVPHPLFVQVDTADVGGTEPSAGGQLVEHAAGEVSSVHQSSAVANRSAIPASRVAISGNLSIMRPHRSSAVLCTIASNRSTRSPYLCCGPPSRLGSVVVPVVWPRSGTRAWGRWTAVGVEVERPQRSEDERPRGRRGSTANLAGGEAKTLRFKSSAASWERRTCCGRQRRTCRRPALSGSTDEVRRHDDGWGARRAGCRRGAVAQSLREVHPTTRRWRQANCGSWPQASADLWAGHVRNASQAATSCGRISGSARAASPSSRSV